jgi:hypothetical protein
MTITRVSGVTTLVVTMDTDCTGSEPVTTSVSSSGWLTMIIRPTAMQEEKPAVQRGVDRATYWRPRAKTVARSEPIEQPQVWKFV